jgi:adenine-specific DNA-methyltransferase
MNLTPYHAKYFAYELTKRCPSDSIEKLAGTLVDAQVDLNPHQIQAALFAFRSPLSKGAILADEVGLGKTIEAGLVLSQKWAERKRRILIITPSNLRKQWHQELGEKFFLPCCILESKSYNQYIKQGNARPFVSDSIVICSYHFARSKSSDIATTKWDLVVIDEAHRLRNVYKPSNVIANELKRALKDTPKLLLTATPLQNSLLELFGLVSFVDEHTFGDLKGFREQFANLSNPRAFDMLKARLLPICHRTLRRQVLHYVPFTKRLPLVQPFTPEDSEDHLYNIVSDYLRRENLFALPASQRSLMTLVLRKLLASSTFAIAGALDTLAKRLRAKLDKSTPQTDDKIESDYEAFDETADEWPEDEEAEQLSDADCAAIKQEIADLEQFRDLAVSIEHNAKGKALLIALDRAFKEADRLGAARKAIIFTESRRTQDYLLRTLADSPYGQNIVLFNGSNNDDISKRIYSEWLKRYSGTDKATGSRTADMRSALVDYFREQGEIMIATEAGAEGINLQFCSLVVNYDLPWNPQRIEQRIGRCHRYGQKNDVVVVNFLNQKNEADQRVFKLLSEKFHLFEGVFGASDEVLGAIESGIDFEKRIVSIYQKCRKTEEIGVAFDQLQLELSVQINEAMTRTRQQLLEHFDDEVRDKLKVSDVDSKSYLNKYEQMLMRLTQFELADYADFLDDSTFMLKTRPFNNGFSLGLYELPRRSGEAHLYRLSHPLAQHVLKLAMARTVEPAEVVFNYSGYEGKISDFDSLVGKSGHLSLSFFTVESFDQAEDYLIFSTVTDDGDVIDENVSRRFFSLSASVAEKTEMTDISSRMEEIANQRVIEIKNAISGRNAKYFEDEAEKIDGWADDIKLGLEREIKEIDRQIKEEKRSAIAALTLEDKLAGQKRIKALEANRNAKRRELFDAQDEVDRRRDQFIKDIEAKLKQKTSLSAMFTVKWSIV